MLFDSTGIYTVMAIAGVAQPSFGIIAISEVNQNQAQAQNQQVNVILQQPLSSNAFDMYGYGRLNNENHVYDRDQVHAAV